MKHMRLDRAGLLVVGAQVLAAAMALAQDTYKAEASGSPPADLPKAVQDALQPAGARLVDGHGAVVCEMWLRKSVPAQEGGGGSADVLYPGLGVGTMIAIQVFVNIGMNIGIMPITGIPLPFLSYGGSALIADFIGIGLVLNVQMRRFA